MHYVSFSNNRQQGVRVAVATTGGLEWSNTYICPSPSRGRDLDKIDKIHIYIPTNSRFFSFLLPATPGPSVPVVTSTPGLDGTCSLCLTLNYTAVITAFSVYHARKQRVAVQSTDPGTARSDSIVTLYGFADCVHLVYGSKHVPQCFVYLLTVGHGSHLPSRVAHVAYPRVEMADDACIPLCTVRSTSLYRTLRHHGPFHHLDHQLLFPHGSCRGIFWDIDHVGSIMDFSRTNLGPVETKPVRFGRHVGSVGWSTGSQFGRDQLASTICYDSRVLCLVYGQVGRIVLPILCL